MDVLIFLIPIALSMAGAALAAFLWSLAHGQYEDLKGAAARILVDDDDDAAR
jgi:cbb3-type cytochrome oxidase maturation protein